MKVFVSCILVFLAASYVVAAGNVGEKGNRCKFPVGSLVFPTLKATCESDCKFNSVYHLASCNGGLKCCIYKKDTPETSGTTEIPKTTSEIPKTSSEIPVSTETPTTTGTPKPAETTETPKTTGNGNPSMAD